MILSLRQSDLQPPAQRRNRQRSRIVAEYTINDACMIVRRIIRFYRKRNVCFDPKGRATAAIIAPVNW